MTKQKKCRCFLFKYAATGSLKNNCDEIEGFTEPLASWAGLNAKCCLFVCVQTSAFSLFSLYTTSNLG